MRTTQIARLWQVIRDVDLEAIRTGAERAFELRIIAGDGALAERLRRLLSEPLPAPHPWVTAPPAPLPGDTLPLAAIAITGGGAAERMTAALSQLAAARVPVLGVTVGGPTVPAVPDAFETRRARVEALDKSALATIGPALLELLSLDDRLAIARHLPALRSAYARLTIDETSRANATYALTTGLGEAIPLLTVPLNVGDIIVLTKNQLVMAYRLMLAAGHRGEPRELMGEIMGVLGSGLLFRQVARQLVGLIPVFGILPKVAIAYAGTWAIGHAVAAWAFEGREVTRDSVRRYSSEGLERGRAVARGLLERAKRARKTRSAAADPAVAPDSGPQPA